MTDGPWLGRVLRTLSERLSSARPYLEFAAAVSGTWLVSAAPNPPTTGLQAVQILAGAVLITAAGTSAGLTLLERLRATVHEEVHAAIGGTARAAEQATTSAGPGWLQRNRRSLLALALLVVVGVAGVVAWPRAVYLWQGVSYPTFGCPAVVTQLRMIADPETVMTAREVAAVYERESAAGNHGCPPARIFVYPAAAGAVAERVKAPGDWPDDALGTIGPLPDLWLTSTAHDLDTLLPGPESTHIAQRVAVAGSPVVLALPASGSGAPTGRSWAELFRSYTAPGAPGLARPGPSGGTGLAATALLYESVRRSASQGATPWEESNPAAIEGRQGPERTPVGDTADLLCQRRGPTPAADGRAIITTEQEVARYNAGLPLGASCGPGPPPTNDRRLAALYPTDTGNQDVTLVRLAWDGPPQQQAAAAFADWLQGDAGRAALVRTGLRPIGAYSSAAPLGTGFGVDPTRPAAGPVAGSLLDGAAASFARTQQAARLLVLFDTSGSMGTPEPGGTRAEVAAAAVQAGLRHLGPHDTVGVWLFPGGGPGHTEAIPTGPATDQAIGDVGAKVGDAVVAGRAPLFRAVSDGVAALAPTALRPAARPPAAPSADDPPGVRALVVVTDGADTTGQVSAEAVTRAITGRGVRVVVVALDGVRCTDDGLAPIVTAPEGACVDATSSTVVDQLPEIVDELKGAG